MKLKYLNLWKEADVVLELDDRKKIQNLKVICVKTELQPLGATSGRRQYFLFWLFGTLSNKYIQNIVV